MHWNSLSQFNNLQVVTTTITCMQVTIYNLQFCLHVVTILQVVKNYSIKEEILVTSFWYYESFFMFKLSDICYSTGVYMYGTHFLLSSA